MTSVSKITGTTKSQWTKSTYQGQLAASVSGGFRTLGHPRLRVALYFLASFSLSEQCCFGLRCPGIKFEKAVPFPSNFDKK